MMGDFMKKYLPFYIFFLIFFTFVAVGLEVSTGLFSITLPSEGAFTTDFLTNTGTLMWSIVSFRGDGVPDMIATVAFYLPSIPVILWLVELVIGIVKLIIDAFAALWPF